MKPHLEFTVLKTDDGSETGDFALLFKSPDHVTPLKIINEHVGKEVVRMRGTGIGVNLQIVDFDAWSDYISSHVLEIAGSNGSQFHMALPDEKIKRED